MQSILKKYISKLALLVLLIQGTGCSKWLEDKDVDPSNLSPDTYYTVPAHADAAIAAAYAQTRFINGGAGIFANNFSMVEMVTGTAKTETGQNTDLNNLIGLSYNGDNVFVNNWWNGAYSVIAQTNLVLEKVPNINPMDEAQKKRVLGEARFLRAWSYFYLVRLFGDVPLITKPVDATSPDLLPGRTAKETVYKQIVDDLVEAEGAGLSWTDATGRASMGAVKSLLAEVYLTMAGQPLNKGAAYYKLAADKANEVIASNQFSLFTNYMDLHSISMENRTEQIFELQYLSGVADNPNQGILLPNFKDVSAYGTEIGSTVPTLQFYNSFEAGDKRTVDRQGFFYTSYYDGGNGALKNLSAPYIFKHFDIIANGTAGVKGTATSSLNWMNMRYAQVLLTFAEAQNEVGGPTQGAWDALNAIRSRAGLTTPALGTFNQASFREAVWRERWHELCYEQITWFDMVRLRKVYNEATNAFDNFVGHKFPDNGATLQEKHLLFPLPTAEMQNNPNLKPNNPGYN
ncbi:RagB/SusD family nutrient uptake outer membrane protein [Flavisolibacter nicotianae]|uniref:RagB/SusD family nutrient uptake outer membrane protein n=1 Tax=Flavisolibacter nicotianae TaxID=2364882 RepID=UPI000EB42A5B|nr:RagB/SusD family nutrient uptake outer membrane protein [Flavisolibacter nicotianae]